MAEFWPAEWAGRAASVPTFVRQRAGRALVSAAINPTEPGAGVSLGMVEKSGLNGAAARIAAWLDALRGELDAVRRDLASGEAVDAERRAKAVSAFVRAARDLSDLETQARTAPKETDKDDVVADLERRLAGLAADTDANGVSAHAESGGAGDAAR